VTLLLDAAPLIALADRRDPYQPVVERHLSQERGRLILPAPVSAEVDYMLGQRLGRRARQAFLADLSSGRFDVVCLNAAEYERVRWLDERYADLDVGLADLSLVVLAERFQTERILTFDERRFRALRTVDGRRFHLLPQDSARRTP
jgi:predicted nucleic acid-binding protein